MNPTRRWIYPLLLILIVLGVIEGMFFLAGRILAGMGHVVYIRRPWEGYGDYLRYRDPLLGWPYPSSFNQGQRDGSGSRLIPAFPDPDEDQDCVSVYGDSFTWGLEVDNEHTYSNVLSKRLDCRVANYGVNGYGTDQAYLRFQSDSEDEAEIVILSHVSMLIMRNVNQFRGLTHPNETWAYKPRFVLDENGELAKIPIPYIPESEHEEFTEFPERYLKHEYFLPGSRFTPEALEFPYTLSVLWGMLHWYSRSDRTQVVPSYAEFYRQDHPSDALRLTAEILRSFDREARSRGKIPVIALLGRRWDLEYFEEEGVWVYESLIDELRNSGIEPLHVGELMMDRLGDADPSTLFAIHHFNEAGHEMWAALVEDYLRENDILPGDESLP